MPCIMFDLRTTWYASVIGGLKSNLGCGASDRYRYHLPRRPGFVGHSPERLAFKFDRPGMGLNFRAD